MAARGGRGKGNRAKKVNPAIRTPSSVGVPGYRVRSSAFLARFFDRGRFAVSLLAEVAPGQRVKPLVEKLTTLVKLLPFGHVPPRK